MASGGYELVPTDETDDNERGRDNKGADNNDDDDDDIFNTDLSQYKFEKRPPRDPNRTQPFKPGASSTPFGDGERMPLSSRTRLPKEKGPRFAETSFIEGEPQQEETLNERFAWQEVKDAFPNAEKSRLKARSITAPRAGLGGGGAVLEVAMRGKTNGIAFTHYQRGTPKRLSISLFQKKSKQGSTLGKVLSLKTLKSNKMLNSKKRLGKLSKRTKRLQMMKMNNLLYVNGLVKEL